MKKILAFGETKKPCMVDIFLAVFKDLSRMENRGVTMLMDSALVDVQNI